ncbi:SURF1 family protein [Thauera linaloolentis]|uniref:SURF1-like protein n=1 Tax=Thauera linaloolentis (strain DSM 12138 / JCM 21573 / CCUG 41526 / CIP 105981 / IAM 15112 / NBRC 102519 / 47Lol) TaxID=1123367 RepID=N6Y492_THAL4|nr:SURF1 family protein [Thauera linaloolentis]ENO86400.1 hypothetical protein C666_13290 [Thauera linaloolentis 47Lol = DSM 12138]MCM8564213.1 SURF1 family protein [Thauera linaloolentis]
MPALARLRLLLPLLAGALVTAAAVALGNWQVRRAQEKAELQAVLDAAARRPALRLAALPGIGGLEAGRVLRLEGEWLPAAGVFLDNRTHAGRAGYHVLMPLRLADGSGAVLVNRGWVSAGADRGVLPAVPADPGRVVVDGRLQVPEADAFTLARAGQGTQGRVWQVLDMARLAERSVVEGGGAVLPLCPGQAGDAACFAPWLVLQTSASGDGLVRDWLLPAAGIDRHRGYAFQWYALAALAAALTGAHAWRVFLRRTHDERNPRLAGH